MSQRAPRSSVTGAPGSSAALEPRAAPSIPKQRPLSKDGASAPARDFTLDTEKKPRVRSRSRKGRPAAAAAQDSDSTDFGSHSAGRKSSGNGSGTGNRTVSQTRSVSKSPAARTVAAKSPSAAAVSSRPATTAAAPAASSSDTQADDDDGSGSDQPGSDDEGAKTKKRMKGGKRNRPLEMSSKKPIALEKLRPVQHLKPKTIDPRFDTSAGDYDPHMFRTAYRFIDDAKKEELADLQLLQRKVKSQEKKKTLQSLIQQYKSDMAVKDRDERKRELQSSWVREERKRVEQGKNPFYLKKSAVKDLDLVDQFVKLKDTGRLDNVMDSLERTGTAAGGKSDIDRKILKQRSKRASKDRKFMPYKNPNKSG